MRFWDKLYTLGIHLCDALDGILGWLINDLQDV